MTIFRIFYTPKLFFLQKRPKVFYFLNGFYLLEIIIWAIEARILKSNIKFGRQDEETVLNFFALLVKDPFLQGFSCDGSVQEIQHWERFNWKIYYY